MIKQEQITYWFGVVEDINDPMQLDRVRVRVYGAHSANKQISDIDGTPTEHLMWMNTIMPVTQAQFSGVGQRHGLLPGSSVFGMYIDPEMQTGVVMGQMQTQNSQKDPNQGFQDPSGTFPYNNYKGQSSLPERARGIVDATELLRQSQSGGAGSYVPDLTKPGIEDSSEKFKLADILKCEEGAKVKPYRDSKGYWTVGIGHLITMNVQTSLEGACQILQKMIGRKIVPGESITQQEMYDLFKEDLVKHEAALDKYPHVKMTYNTLNLPRKMMLIQMCFQMGIGNLAEFKNSLNKMVQKDWRGAYEGLLASGWAHQTPERAKRVAAVMYEGNLEPYVGYMKSHGYQPNS